MAQPNVIILESDLLGLEMTLASTFTCKICSLPKPNTERQSYIGRKGQPEWSMVCQRCASLSRWEQKVSPELKTGCPGRPR
jgi:hypothetical protein